MSDFEKLQFASDYQEGAHPELLRRLTETNLLQTPGYGLDAFSEAARDKIRAACHAPEADVFFLAGGTQTNAVMIKAMLRPWQGVMAAETGHISAHEAGAIEADGHKVFTLPQKNGKLSADAVKACLEAYRQDENRDHMVSPGMVYLSQPTEYGTLYSLSELEAIAAVCREFEIPLYLDGARLAYALSCPANDVTLPDIARLCTAFYIGGTKCGALFGEAAVLPRHNAVPHLFTLIKQHGALLAKGRVAGVQFDTLFTNGLYDEVGRTAIAAADRIRAALTAKGIALCFGSPTNQIFLLLTRAEAARLQEKVALSFWENPDENHTILRLATSWATTDAQVDRLLEIL